jgi:hypothetical protein
MWSNFYYEPEAKEIRKGNAFLPIKTIVHRWSNRYPWLYWKDGEKLLDAYWKKLPIYKIPEQEYIEFTI